MREKAELANLTTVISKFSHNIIKFNSHVFATIQSLKRNGSTTHDVIHQLFPVYLICLDKACCDYIKQKRNQFKEGDPMYYVALMCCVRHKYQTLMDKGKQEAPDAQ